MSTVTLTGTVTDSAGATAPFSGTIIIANAPIISSIVVVPLSAPANTLRTITINATDPNTPALPLTYTCVVNGKPATATAAPNVFTAVV